MSTAFNCTVATGGAASCSLGISYMTTVEETHEFSPLIQHVRNLENRLGCKFWLAQSFNNKTGWELKEGLRSELTNKDYQHNNITYSKLSRLTEDIMYSDEIKDKCEKSKKEEYVPLRWYDVVEGQSEKSWQLDVNEWTEFKPGSLLTNS